MYLQNGAEHIMNIRCAEDYQMEEYGDCENGKLKWGWLFCDYTL